MAMLTGSAGWIAAGPGEEEADEDDGLDATPAAMKAVPSSSPEGEEEDAG